MKTILQFKWIIATLTTVVLMLAGLYVYKTRRTGLDHIHFQFSEAPEKFLTEEEHNHLKATTNKASHPNMYLDHEDIARIRQKLKNDPWQRYLSLALAEADRELKSPGYNVTKNGGPSNGHDYITEKPYCGWNLIDPSLPDCRDGLINPQADRSDYTEVINFSAALSNLGLAYQFTGKEIYAQKGVDLIRVWCIDPDTRMNPRIIDDQSYIELFVSLPGMLYGADLIHDFSGWPANDMQAFKSWVRQMAEEAIPFQKSNNMQNWKINFIAAAGALLDDPRLLAHAFGRFKELIQLQIDRKGRIITELDRTKSLTYSLFGLNALMSTAEIGRHFGLDLYGYSTADRKSLKLALDFHAPFALKSKGSAWPYRQIVPLTANDNVALYELAWTRYRKPAYWSVINSWGRPLRDIRIHKQLTLTHGINP